MCISSFSFDGKISLLPEFDSVEFALSYIDLTLQKVSGFALHFWSEQEPLGPFVEQLCLKESQSRNVVVQEYF